MITKKTVLVLGAGASMPYGFPSGRDLKDKICNMLSSPSDSSFEPLARMGFGENYLMIFAQALSRSGQPSVDAFLEHQPDFVELGKVVTAWSLLPYERTHSLFDEWREKRLSVNINQNDWYELLFNELIEDVEFESFADKNELSVITFNYDRSLEHYLFTALWNSFPTRVEMCAEKVNSIPIVHVHGCLGRLDWQTGSSDIVPYDVWEGESAQKISAVTNASNSIKIIHEAPDNDPDFIRARELLSSATVVYFLGFGFHPANCQRLKIGSITNGKWLYGTFLGLSKKRKETIAITTSGRLQVGSNAQPRDIYEFLHEWAPLY